MSKFIYHVPLVASNQEQLAKFQQFGKPARAILWGYKGKVEFSFRVESSSGELNNVEIKKNRTQCTKLLGLREVIKYHLNLNNVKIFK